MTDAQHVSRKAGVVTGRRRMPWQKFWHGDLEARLMQVGLQAAGVYQWLRVFAGHAWNEGTVMLSPDNAQASKREVQGWIARKLGGEQWKEQVQLAGDLLEELRRAGLVVWGRGNVVVLVNWALEQSRAPSMDAERQRRRRDRLAGGYQEEDEADRSPGDQSVDDRLGAPGEGREGTPAPGLGGQEPAPPTGAHEGPAPLPSAASTSTPTSGAYGFDRSGRSERDKSVTSHAQSQNEDERDQTRSSNSTPTAGRGRPAPTAAEGRGAGPSCPIAGEDIYAMDPVDAACLLTGERGQWARNGFAKAYRHHGGELFRQALGEYRQAWQDGIQPKTTPGGMFHGILNRRAQEWKR